MIEKKERKRNKLLTTHPVLEASENSGVTKKNKKYSII